MFIKVIDVQYGMTVDVNVNLISNAFFNLGRHETSKIIMNNGSEILINRSDADVLEGLMYGKK